MDTKRPEIAFGVTGAALTADVLLARNEFGTHAHPASFLLFATLVLLPLNVLAVFLWARAVFSAYRHYVPGPDRPCKVIENYAAIRVWFSLGSDPIGIRLIATAMALATAAVVGLAMALIIGFTFRSRPELPLTAVLSGWAVVLGSAAVMFLAVRCGWDLTIDKLAKSLVCPRQRAGQTPGVVPIERIRSVEVERIEKKRRDRFALVVVFLGANDSPERRPICELTDPDEVQRQAVWLREQLGINPAASGEAARLV